MDLGRLTSISCVGMSVLAVASIASCSGDDSTDAATPVVVAQPADAGDADTGHLAGTSDADATAGASSDSSGQGAGAGGSSPARPPQQRPPTPPRANPDRGTANAGSGQRRPKPAPPSGERPSPKDQPPQQLNDLGLPQEVIDLINDPRYGPFRQMCSTYNDLRLQMQPIEKALATGSATDAQVAEFYRLEGLLAKERAVLNKYKWQDKWSAQDKRAMGLIMTLPPQ